MTSRSDRGPGGRIGTQLNVELDDPKLIKRLKLAATRKGITVKEAVTDALTKWLGRSK